MFAQVGHFIKNWWFTHDYLIYIEDKENVHFTINGPNSENQDFIKYIKHENDSLIYTIFDTKGEFIRTGTKFTP